MAKKTSRKSATPKTEDAAAVDAPAAQVPDVIEDLSEVESAIDEAQRAAGDLAEAVDEAATASVETSVTSAPATEVESNDAMDEIVSALEDVERSQDSAGLPTSLKEYDKAIAGAVDDMLVGDFVSVDLVLEGMNETTPPPEVPESEQAAAIEEQREDASESSDEEAEQVEAAPDDHAEERAESTPEPSDELHELQGDSVDASEISSVKAAPGKPTSAKSQQVAASVATRKRAPEATAPREETSAAEPEGKSHTIGQTVRGATGAAMPFARDGVIAALSLLSFPMKLIPPSAREIVNWIALSLLVWVPIVWFFALFIVG